MGGHYTTLASQPAIMTREHLEACRHLFGTVPEWVELECDIRSVESRNFAEREVVGRSENGIASGTGKHAGQTAAYGFSGEYNITAPATDAAKQWQGWGTALKPALEPITVARKPITGTVAENVLKHGTGAINVEASRIDGDRWPANFIHDGSKEATRLLGDAHRFFYSAKAGNEERADDNNHPTVKPTDLMRYLCRLVTPPNGIVLDPFMGSGSTGVAAILEGFRFVGIEREPHYHQIATKRIDRATAKPKQSRLF